jgi:hypothetical protein
MCLPVKPFRVEREWKYRGLSCAVVLAREAGHRCGYVRVPPDHPLYGKDWDAMCVRVHGTVTFAEMEPCTDHEDGRGYWIGFDCGHFNDAHFDPNIRPEDCQTDEAKMRLTVLREACLFPDHLEHYWTQPEVEAETERLAEQLANMIGNQQ